MADEAMGIRHVNLLARPPRRVCPNFGNVTLGYHPVTGNGEALAKFFYDGSLLAELQP